jgi:hypothetical protein
VSAGTGWGRKQPSPGTSSGDKWRTRSEVSTRPSKGQRSWTLRDSSRPSAPPDMSRSASRTSTSARDFQRLQGFCGVANFDHVEVRSPQNPGHLRTSMHLLQKEDNGSATWGPHRTHAMSLGGAESQHTTVAGCTQTEDQFELSGISNWMGPEAVAGCRAPQAMAKFRPLISFYLHWLGALRHPADQD